MPACRSDCILTSSSVQRKLCRIHLAQDKSSDTTVTSLFVTSLRASEPPSTILRTSEQLPDLLATRRQISHLRLAQCTHLRSGVSSILSTNHRHQSGTRFNCLPHRLRVSIVHFTSDLPTDKLHLLSATYLPPKASFQLTNHLSLLRPVHLEGPSCGSSYPRYRSTATFPTYPLRLRDPPCTFSSLPNRYFTTLLI